VGELVEFPNLSILMASIGMSKKDLAKIIKKAPSAITEKLSGKTEFKLTEIEAITEHFKKVFPERDLPIKYIFCRKGNYSYQEQNAS
jgi:hypothetical protein